MKVFFFLAGMCTAFFCMTALAALPAPPEGPIAMNWTRRPVLFSHQTHAAGLSGRGKPETACALCHHPVEGKETFLPCASEGCHDSLNPKDKSLQSYYQATHKKKKEKFYSCVSCHEETAGRDIAKKKHLAGCKESACHPS